VEEKQPGISEALEKLVEAHTKGDPMALLLWTSKSVRNLSSALREMGYTASHVLVSSLLKYMGYTLQADRKDIAINSQHPDRNAQFEYINEQAKLFYLKGAPVLSIDAKKKEKIGNFANKGRSIRIVMHNLNISMNRLSYFILKEPQSCRLMQKRRKR